MSKYDFLAGVGVTSGATAAAFAALGFPAHGVLAASAGIVATGVAMYLLACQIEANESP